jgi:hypothetical protein
MKMPGAGERRAQFEVTSITNIITLDERPLRQTETVHIVHRTEGAIPLSMWIQLGWRPPDAEAAIKPAHSCGMSLVAVPVASGASRAH